MTSKTIIILLGPTASGKTHLGVQLARHINGEIISADSRQVYRGLDIGSGKDLEEYESEGRTIPYHLIDIIDLTSEYSVFDFQHDFYNALERIQSKHHFPVLVGGTGLYLEAALKPTKFLAVPENQTLRQMLGLVSDETLTRKLLELKPRQHNTTNLIDRDRMIRAIEIAEYEKKHQPEKAPAMEPLILGVKWDREKLRERISLRLKQRMDTGLIDEVRKLQEQHISWDRLDQLGLEYRFVADYLQGKFNSTEVLFDKLYLAICDFAKRQRAWFRRMERQGYEIEWIEEGNLDQAISILRKYSILP